ncbi:MAG: GNAT family N-acetyltransferase [Flavobacteriaceae bacterium]|nr:GNAT family N-acetyltransferase [Flavobacteriaceae bacterium]|tara:strand:- start:13506 stop:13949 length:444 start_codon:yes stop_codon:yes gene_type:complete
MIKIFTKRFNQLSKNELYKIFHIRSKVFIVEQNCIYQDIDFKDQKALHILIKKKKEIIGYSRIFKPGDYFKKASIGRVVISKENRGKGYGKILMRESIKAIENNFKEKEIKISAQKYLLDFYTSIGFKKEGEEYLEDGIPHISMIKN